MNAFLRLIQVIVVIILSPLIWTIGLLLSLFSACEAFVNVTLDLFESILERIFYGD